MNKRKTLELADLLDSGNPDRVIEEIKTIFSMISLSIDLNPVEYVFSDIVRLFKGEYPGYRKCMTGYHNLEHTMETFVAMGRLLHGYFVEKGGLSETSITLGLISALMHDTGYILKEDEASGTGAQYTLTHISRSISFMEEYFHAHGFPERGAEYCRNCILCTNINTKTSEIRFSSREEETIGKMLGVSDLLSQLANRCYLENLVLLYEEFKEGNVSAFKDEFDLLSRTNEFFGFVRNRFRSEFDGLDDYMVVHFKNRFNIDEDLYRKSIEKNARYLAYLLENKGSDIFNHLRRKGIVKKSARGNQQDGASFSGDPCSA